MMIGMDTLTAIKEETDEITIVLKEDESRGSMHDALERAETGICCMVIFHVSLVSEILPLF